MKEQIVIRTSPEDSPIALAKKFMKGYTVIICNPVGEYLEYILEKDTENSNHKSVCGWKIKVTDSKYYYKCSKCGDQYAVVRKVLGHSYGEEYKYIKNYCSRCGRKMEFTEHED